MPLYINTEDHHNKFWGYEIINDDPPTVETSHGRIGRATTTNTKSFDTSAKLQKFIDTKVREKERKGYKLSDEKQLDKQVKVAELLGTENKIRRIEYVNVKGNTLGILGNYDPKKAIYVEVQDSWSKRVSRMLLQEGNDKVLEGVTELDRKIIVGDFIDAYDKGQFRKVREALRLLSEQVVKIVTRKLASLGSRKLNLGGVQQAQSVDTTEVFEELDSSAVSQQVVGKVAALGKRKLII